LSEQDLQVTPGRRFERPPGDDAGDAPDPAATPAPARARLLSGGLFALGLAAGVVGVHDALLGDNISARLVGTLVALAGVILITGAVGVLHNSQRGRSLGSVACLVGAALGVMLGVSQLVNDRPSAMLALWIAIVVGMGIGAVVLRHDLPSAWRELPILKSVVTVGVLTSLAQFWYSSIYVPASAPPSLTLAVSLQPVDTAAKRVTLRGSATIKNTSGTRVNTISSFVLVYDSAIDQRDRRSTDFSQALHDAAGGGPPAEAFSQDAGAEIIHLSQLVPEATYFETGETVTVPFTVYVPPRRFHVVTAEVYIFFARASLRLDTGDARTAIRGATIARSTPISTGGWIRELTRGERYLRSTWIVAPDRPFKVEVGFSPDRDRAGPEGFDKRLRDFYGYSTANGSVQVPLSAGKQR
jgi:uncharacterized membrane protein HdeD (DUF308 family)